MLSNCQIMPAASLQAVTVNEQFGVGQLECRASDSAFNNAGGPPASNETKAAQNFKMAVGIRSQRAQRFGQEESRFRK
jgi:hypothetical protein